MTAFGLTRRCAARPRTSTVRRSTLCVVALLGAILCATMRSEGGRSLRAPSAAFLGTAGDSQTNVWSETSAKLPGLAEYLLESGYAWPIAGFFVAALILWRRGFCSSSKRPEFDGSQGLQCDSRGFETRGAEISTPLPRGGAEIGTPQPSVSGVSMREMEQPGMPPQRFNGPMYGVPPDMQYGHPYAAMPHTSMMPPGTPTPYHPVMPHPASMPHAPALSQQDLYTLMERSRHDEQLKEGVACIKSVFSQQSPDLPSRMGIMTARKVIEIESMLIQELEESLINKVGFVASVFHNWRAEATLLRVGRQFEDDFSTQRGEWENYLTDQQRTWEDKLSHADRMAKEQKERQRQAMVLLADKWAHGDVVGLQHGLFKAWAEYTHKTNVLAAQRQRVHTVVMCWAEGNKRGTMHMCFKNWHGTTASAKALQQKQEELNDTKKSWEDYLDEANKKHQAEIDSAMQELDAKRARAKKDVGAVLAKWERGDRHGLMSTVLIAWQQYNRKIRMLRRQQASVHQAVLQFIDGTEMGSLQGCFNSWRNHTQHMRELHSASKKWEDLLNGERSRREQEEADRLDEHSRRIESAHGAVEMVSRKWMLGSNSGILSEVVDAWCRFVLKRGATLKRREAVHSTLTKWLEGDVKGTMHVCFVHWKVDAKHSQLRLQHEQELKKEQQIWEDMLTDEKRRHEDLLADHRTDAQKRQDQAHAVVAFTLNRWDLGDDAGLLTSVLRGWSVVVREANRLSRKRQAVHVALMKLLEGETQAMVHACLKNWHHWTRHALQQRFGEKQLAEERQRLEQFVENQQQAHADELQAVMSEGELRRARAHEATELMLRQWVRGDTAGLLGTVVAAWRRLKDDVAMMNWRKQTVHGATLRFIEGEGRGQAHCCFLNWKHWAKIEVVYRAEVYERDRKITQLEDRTRSFLGREQARLLKYAGMLGNIDNPMLLLMVLANWRVHSNGVKALEAERLIQVELEEMQRVHDINVLKRKHLTSSTFELMGCKNNSLVLMDGFLAWAQYYKEQKQEWAHKLTHQKMVSKYCTLLLTEGMKQDTMSLLAACFAELIREAKHEKHAREREERDRQLQEAQSFVDQLQDDRSNLEERLREAYKQIDEIFGQLQRELKTKEDMAVELKEAYDKLRTVNTSGRAPPRVSPGSLKSVSRTESDGPGHIPSSFGQGGLSLNKSLVSNEESS